MPKEKNSAALGDLAGGHRRARQLDHRADLERGADAGARSMLDAPPSMISARTSSSSWTVATSGIMISGCGSPPALIAQRRGLEDRPGLHREQAGDHDAEPDPAQPEHRVLLVQPLHRVEQRAARFVSTGAPRSSCERDLDRQVGVVGQELVQRRVDQPDRDRQPVHRLEDPDEVVALHRQQLGERLLLLVVALGQDQVLDERRRSPRNMCSVRHSPMPWAPNRRARARVVGGVGVGPHGQPAGARRRAP